MFVLLFSSLLFSSLLFSTAVIVGLLVTPGRVAADGAVPIEGKGSVAGNSGAFTYAIPIAVAPGRHGLAPNLALTYNSSGGNGIVGVGWDLPIGYVMRSTRHGVDYTCNSGSNCFVFMLGGASSELIPRTDWCSDCYGAKVEGAFIRFRFVSNSYWEATDKAGTKYLLGYTTGSVSRQDGSPGVFKWMLDTATDTNGNSMTYSYLKDQGEIYLNRIDYANTSYVKLYYDQSRTDTAAMAAPNFAVVTAWRLKTIDVWGGGTRVRAYKLVYDTVPSTSGDQYSISTGRSLLTAVQDYGKDATLDGSGSVTGGTSLPALALTWQTGGLGPFYRVLTDATQWNHIIDVNGDGIIDRVWIGPNGTVVEIGQWDGTSYTSNRVLTDTSAAGQWPETGGQKNYLADVNGDGRIDHVWLGTIGTYVDLGQWNGTAYTFTRVQTDTSSATGQWPEWEGQRNYMLDVNGDGRVDHVYLGPSGTYVELGRGDGTFWRVLKDTSVAGQWPENYGQQNFLVDVNGDGHIDHVWLGTAGTYVELGQWNGTAYTFQRVLTDTSAAGQWPETGGQRNYLVDVNGDGRVDHVYLGTTGTYVELGRGDGTFYRVLTDTSAAGQWPETDGQKNYLADVNGDGRIDHVWIGTIGTYVELGWGDGTFRRVLTDTSAAGKWPEEGGNKNYLVDVNGDGLLDHVWTGSVGTSVEVGTGPVPDLLASIATGLGSTTTVSYTTSTSFVNTYLPFPVNILRQLTQVTTLEGDGTTVTSTTIYRYAGGFYHPGERDFRGFKSVEFDGPVAPSGEQAFYKTWYHQGDDVAVGVNNVVDANGVPLPTVGYMSGKPYQSRVSDPLGEVRSWTTTSYVSDDTPPYFNPPAQVLTATAHCNGVPCGKQTQTDYVGYDAYGNVTREDQYGDIVPVADNRTVVRTFSSPNTADWIVGLPTSETIYRLIGTSNKMSETRFYYDNGTLGTQPVKGNLTKVERWLDPGPANTYLATIMAYDSYGNLTSTTDAKGYVTSLCYDATAIFPQRVTNPLNRQTKTEYYGVTWNTACGTAPAAFTGSGLYGQVKTVTDPNNVQAKTEYDTLGRVTTVTRLDGSWSTTAYNSIGGGVGVQNIRTDTAAGLSTWVFFDGLGRNYLEKRTGPDGTLLNTQTVYDARGAARQTSLPYFGNTSSPAGLWTTTVRDALGRPRWVSSPDGAKAFSCTNDWTSIAIDANGHKRREVRDAAGRLVEVNEYTGTFAQPTVGDWTCDTALGTPYATTTYEYNVVGNLVKVIDAKGNRTTMRYDSLGRKIGMADPDMGSCGDLTTLAPASAYPWYAAPCWTYEYDANGNLTRQRDAKSQTIWFRYDALNRVTQKDYNTQKALGSGDVRYTYDTVPTGFTDQTYYQIGRLSQVVDTSGTARFGYDLMARIKRTSKIVSGATYTTKTTYDSLGRVATITYPDNSIVSNEYNGPLLKRVYEGSTNYAQYASPNALGQPASLTYGNNVVTNYTYANTGNATAGCTTNTFRLCTMITGTVQNLTYGYDAVGNVSSMTDTAALSPIGTQTFTYDDLNRLLTATGPFGAGGAQTTWTYAYNEIGNLLCNPQISTCTAGSPNYTYPTSGPSSVRPHAVTQAGTGIYGYDANGNMTSGPNSKTLSYDYENRPTTISVGGVTTTFVYDGDGGRVKKTTGSVTTTYIGQLYECATACNKYIFAGSQRIAMKPVGGSTINYYHTDHLGSTSLVTDQTGAVVERIGYYPFGQVRTNTGSLDVTHKFTGQRLDASTGLYFYNARYYDPVLARFIQADTIVPFAADPQALNRYSYVRNNPVNLTDPTGYSWFSKVLKRTRDVVARYGAAVVAPAGYANYRLFHMLPEAYQVRIIQIGSVAGSIACAACAPLIAAGSAAAITDIKGGSTRDMVKAGGVAAGASVVASGTSSFVSGSVSPVVGETAGEIVGQAAGGYAAGVTTTLAYGGSWNQAYRAGYQGAAVAGGAAALREFYTSFVGYESDYRPGGAAVAKENGGAVAGANNFGFARTAEEIANNLVRGCYEGSSCSQFFNQIFGLNAVGGFHDMIFTNTTLPFNAVTNWGTMPVAAALTYGAMTSGAPINQLVVDMNITR